MRRFRMVDGEADKAGDYHLLVAGGRAYRPKFGTYIHTVEAFEFLLGLPKDDYLIGFYTTFDATNWLKDVPLAKRERIYLEDKEIFGNYTWWKQYGIQHIPGQFFRVCRVQPNTFPPKALEGSSRTVNEISGWWRGPFLDALVSMGLGKPAELALIAKGKAARGEDTLGREEEEAYCKLECRLGARMMERLRDNTQKSGFELREWRGPGTLASFLLNANLIPKRPKKPTRPARIDCSHEEHRYPDNSRWRMAVMTGLIGARIESAVVGRLDSEVLVYDRRSSYAHGLLDLPCPKHTNWVRFKGEPKSWRWYLAQGSWASKERIKWGPLPARTKQQAIVYPMSVNGWWWNYELDGLEGFQFTGGWGADRECDCQPWAFVNDAYQRRLDLGKAGDPLKLALTAIPGKLAQRKHRQAAHWRDLVMAGMVYSQTRRAMRDCLDEHTIKVATDAIYTTRPLAVKQTSDIGNWQMTELKDGIFIVQPGIFWTPDHGLVKSRGFSRATINRHIADLERAWKGWNPIAPPPSYTVPVDLFVTHKAAAVLKQPELFAKWKQLEIPLSFDWQPRRHPAFEMRENHVVTYAPDRHQKSVPYDPSLISEMEKLDILMQGMPDG